ncbi:MAG: phospholipase D-like domain-containing protein [Bacteroidales bacterium]
MKLSDFAINEITPYITGDDHTPSRSGRELVKLFNSYGCRDVYDENGLPQNPKMKNGQRFSRKQFVNNRLKQIAESGNARELIEQVIGESDNPDNCAESIDAIIKEEGYAVDKKENKYSIIGGVINKMTPVRNEAHFNEIQTIILSVLDEAKVSINAAVAWITNDLILKKLEEKQNEGVDVQVAIYDDGINKKYGVDLSNIKTHKIKKSDRSGIMHDKYCVIDNQVVITGSYNWTNNAEFRNDENITVERDPSQATKYSQDFKRIIST